MAEAFDANEHDARIVEYYRRQARIKAFDQFIDLALDGVVTLDEAIEAYKADGQQLTIDGLEDTSGMVQ